MDDPVGNDYDEEGLRFDRMQQAAWLARDGEQAHARGEHMQALELYLEAVNLDPEWIHHFYGLGRAAFEAGECDIAYLALSYFGEHYWSPDYALTNETRRLLGELEASQRVSESLVRPALCLSVSAPWLDAAARERARASRRIDLQALLATRSASLRLRAKSSACAGSRSIR